MDQTTGENVVVAAKPIHSSFVRLLEVAAEHGLFDLADIADHIGETTSAVGMWRYRGVSNRGAVRASVAFGCSAARITGEEAPSKEMRGYSALAMELAAHFDATASTNKVAIFVAAVNAINAAARPGESPHGDGRTPPPPGAAIPEKPRG